MESSGKLADFIRRKMAEQNLSAADVARRAGNELSPTIITKIVSGEVRRSSTKTLALIAKGLGVPELDMFRAASGDDVSRSLHHQIYAERFDAQDLTETEWQFLELHFKQAVDVFRHGKMQRIEEIKRIGEGRPAEVVAGIEGFIYFTPVSPFLVLLLHVFLVSFSCL